MVLTELLKDFPPGKSLVTRRYPVNLVALQDKLSRDLRQDFDAILHLGQSPGASSIKLEAIAVNAAGCIDERGDELEEIVPSGPVAYRSNMPLKRWATLLRHQNIPAVISYHAGTFLCNATMYLSHHQCQQRQAKQLNPHFQPCLIGFVHLPLATEQVAQQGQSLASLPLSTLVRAVHLLLDDLHNMSHEQIEQIA